MNEFNTLRVDKWLWAARFYKTRQLAVKALKNGKIGLGGQTIKPSTNIKVGDNIKIKQGPYLTTIVVDDLKDKRGSASIAKTLYHETKDSIAAKETLKLQLANQPKIEIDQRKPDKRGVRSHRSLKRGE